MNYYKIKFRVNDKVKSEIIQANTSLRAKRIIKNQIKNVQILHVSKTNQPLAFSFFEKKRISSQDHIFLIDNLAAISESGLSLIDSIRDMGKHTQNKLIKKILLDIAYFLNQGKYLSEAMKLSYPYFDTYTLNMIEAGEESGTLDINLRKLAQSLEVKDKNKSQMKKALRYPIIVSIAMAIAFTIIIVMVIPQFEELFKSFKIELPVPTLLLIGLKDLILDYWIIMIGFIFLLIYTHKKLMTKHKYKYKYDYFLTKLPVIGKIINMGFIIRYLHVFNTMDEVGVSLIKSIENALKSIDNLYLNAKFEPIYGYINTGKSLTYSFEQTGLFDHMDLASIRTGENSGTKNEMIRKIEKKYTNKYNNLIDNINASIEPLMIMFLVGFILVLALGIFMPMWDISQIMD